MHRHLKINNNHIPCTNKVMIEILSPYYVDGIFYSKGEKIFLDKKVAKLLIDVGKARYSDEIKFMNKILKIKYED